MIKPRMKRRIKHELSADKPTVLIGKHGITEEILAEIDRQLEKTEMIKTKILKPALGKAKPKEIASKIAQQTKSELIEVRGHTFMLYRKKKSSVKKK